MIWPPWARPAAIVAVVTAMLVLAWVMWPAPGPSPAEDALRQQNEALIKANEQLAADAAARTEEAKQLREDANAETQKIPEIRSRRRVARADGQRRSTAILEAPDDSVADVLRAQHERTRRALGALRPAGTGTEGDSGTHPCGQEFDGVRVPGGEGCPPDQTFRRLSLAPPYHPGRMVDVIKQYEDERAADGSFAIEC
jgi:hypothetical protein